jgi:hypothetical protein
LASLLDSALSIARGRVCVGDNLTIKSTPTLKSKHDPAQSFPGELGPEALAQLLPEYQQNLNSWARFQLLGVHNKPFSALRYTLMQLSRFADQVTALPFGHVKSMSNNPPCALSASS